MKPIRLITLLVMAVLTIPNAGAAAAQTPGNPAPVTVTGTVTDAENDTPLPGVNIIVKGTTTGTTSDMDGRYELVAPSADDTLVYSFIGYATREIPIDGRTTIDVALAPAVLQGEELVVTGYQVQRAADLTGAISLVDEEALVNTPADNPIESLQGRVPGLYVSPAGKPGDAPAVRIRGLSTLNDNNPLYVIDGVPTKGIIAQRLNPNDIESIQVLKDAASASIYGSRASNGVIVITTKRAGRETLEVNYSSDFTLSEYANRQQVLNTQERGRVLWQAAINDGADPAVVPIYEYDWETVDGTPRLNAVSWPEYLGDPALGIRTADTDWYDEISRTGLVQQHEVSVAAGSERGGAFLSLRYHGNEAILKEQDFRSVSARINSHYNFFGERLRLGENFTITQSASTPMPEGLGGNPLWTSILVQPIIPVYTENGDYAGPVGEGFDDRDNPVRLIDHNTWDRDERVNVFGNLFADVKLTDRLALNTRVGADWSNFDHRNIERKYETGILSRDFNSLFLNNEEAFNWTANSTLNYVLDTDRHLVDVLAGVEASEFELSNAAIYRRDFAIEALEFFVPDAGTGEQTVSGGGTGHSLLSYFGKANYVYDDRYLAAVTLRYDGSSRFGEDRRYGFFPSVSAAWRLSNEAFVKNAAPFISNLKLRAGWGRTGNQEIGDAASLQLFVPNYGDDDTWGPSGGTAYPIDGSDSGVLPAGYVRVQRANPLLQWEETSELNVGLDFGFFQQRLTGSIDVYDRVTEDILIQPAYLAVVGEGGASWGNAATVETKGVELGLAYDDYDGDFTYRIHGNVGLARDEITDLPEDVVRSYPGNLERTILGQSQFALFGYVADGIFQNQEEVDTHAEQEGKGVGRLRLADLNGDGVINNLDQRFLGDPIPDFDFGLGGQFRYKNFDLSVFLQGVAGVQINNGLKTLTDFVGRNPNTNYGRRVLDAWTPQNPDSDIPAASLKNYWGELQMSSYYVENGAYLKLREVQLGYTLPQRLTQRVASQRARIYLRGGNLLTLTDTSGDDAFTGTDPEFPNNAFPIPRTVTLGLELGF